MHHFIVSRASQLDDRHDIRRAGPNKNNVGGFDRDIRACTDCDPDIRLSQRRRIVHTIAGHRHDQTAGLNFADFSGFFFWQNFGNHFVEANFLTDPFCHLLIVAGQHDALNAHGLKHQDGFRRFLTNDIGQRDCASELVINEHEDDCLALRAQGFEPGIIHFKTLVAQIAGADDFHVAVLNEAFCTFARDRLKLVDTPCFWRIANDPLGDWVFGMSFNRRRIGDDIALSECRIKNERIGNPKLAFG